MKSLLLSTIMLFSTLTSFAQKFPVSDTGVSVNVNKSEVSVVIPEFEGTIKVNYWLKNHSDEIFVGGEYTNMKGFTDKITVKPGTYIIKVIKYDSNGRVKTTQKTFIVK